MTKEQEITFRRFIIEKKIDNMNLTSGQKEKFINKMLDRMNEPETPKHEITLKQLKAALKKSSIKR